MNLAQKDELTYASERLDTIEINGSFYSLQRPSSYRAWAKGTPSGFVFSVKGARFITHLKRLEDLETPLAGFFASCALALEEKLGPFLWQLLPNFKFDAGQLASKHDDHLKERAVLESERTRRLRHAIEIRHESFACEEFIDLVREHRVALVIADTGGKWLHLEDVTADFVYVRLHGPKQLYASGYGDEGLDYREPRIRAWNSGAEPRDAKGIGSKASPRKRGRDVLVYFDNDVKADAARDAMCLIDRLAESAD